MASNNSNPAVRYEPDDKCPPSALIGPALQGIMLVLAPTILVVAITARAAGQDDQYLIWAAFATLVIVGIMMALQAVKIGRFGGGYLIICGVTPNYIAVSVIALDDGGPTMLASLIVASAILYYAIAMWLPLLRRIITPVVAGTVLMLIAALIVPIAIDLVRQVPDNAPSVAGASAAAITVFASAALVMRAPRLWRPWSISLGVIAGCITGAAFGIYDVDAVVDAPWIGVPDLRFPGLDFTPSIGFWALLPMFFIVTLIQSIKNISDGMVVQRISRNKPRATDFRLIQGSIYANGTGILMAGVAGTPPPTTYPSLTVPLVNITRVAARSVGYVMAALLVLLAFFPKVNGALLTIPDPVMGGFLIFAVGLLFIEGIQTLVRTGLDTQKAMIAGLAFAVGLGMQHYNVLADLLPDPWGILLGNGITVGAATAIAFNAFLELSSPRSQRIEAVLDVSALPRVDNFLRGVGNKMGWNEVSTDRLRSAGEEAMELLSNIYTKRENDDPPRLIVSARPDGTNVELEVVTVSDSSNIEDRLAYIQDETETADEAEIPLRLLRHSATSVKHQKYHGLDILTITVAGTK